MKNVVVLFISIFLFSCSGNDEVEIPDNILPLEKMGMIMTDMHLMEAATNLNISNEVSIVHGADLQAAVLALLKKSKVTNEQYQASFAFYSAHPALLAKVYKDVLNNLSELQAKVAHEKEVIPKDSVKNDSVRKESIKRIVKQKKKP